MVSKLQIKMQGHSCFIKSPIFSFLPDIDMSATCENQSLLVRALSPTAVPFPRWSSSTIPANGHTTLISGDPAWSLSTLLRPRTPKTTTTAWTFLATTKKFVWRSGLIIVNSSVAKSPKNDYYCLNLHWLVANLKSIVGEVHSRPRVSKKISNKMTTLSSFKFHLPWTAITHDQQTKTNSQKRLLGILDFPTIYMECLLSNNIFVLSFL